MLDLKAVFTAHKDEYLAFEKVENPRHERPDLCAFLMLHNLAHRTTTQGGQYARAMVTCDARNEIWVDADLALLASRATEADILTLVRCGIRYDRDADSLAMFV